MWFYWKLFGKPLFENRNTPKNMPLLYHGRFGIPEEEKRGGGGGEATPGESVLATPLWGILYADDASVVSRPPEQLRKMMEVIEVVCAAFGLTVSEAKTEIIYLNVKGMPESTATFSVEAAGQVYNQTNEFVYLGGNVNHNADPSMEVDRRNATHGAASGCTPSNCTTD